MDKIYKNRNAAVAILAIAIFILFFLPWVKVHPKAAEAVSGFFGGDTNISVFTISGYGVPVMANGDSAKLAITVLGMFFKNVENADAKSYLIWTIPVLAVLLAVASFFLRGRWIASSIIGAMASLVAIIGTYKILTANLENLMIRVQICWALWTILLFYLLIGIMHFVSISLERKPQENPAGSNAERG